MRGSHRSWWLTKNTTDFHSCWTSPPKKKQGVFSCWPRKRPNIYRTWRCGFKAPLLSLLTLDLVCTKARVMPPWKAHKDRHHRHDMTWIYHVFLLFSSGEVRHFDSRHAFQTGSLKKRKTEVAQARRKLTKFRNSGANPLELIAERPEVWESAPFHDTGLHGSCRSPQHLCTVLVAVKTLGWLRGLVMPNFMW